MGDILAVLCNSWLRVGVQGVWCTTTRRRRLPKLSVTPRPEDARNRVSVGSGSGAARPWVVIVSLASRTGGGKSRLMIRSQGFTPFPNHALPADEGCVCAHYLAGHWCNFSLKHGIDSLPIAGPVHSTYQFWNLLKEHRISLRFWS